VTLANFGGGIEGPVVPPTSELEALDDRLRDEVMELYAREPELFSKTY